MKLLKKITTLVDGFEGDQTETYSYVLSQKLIPNDAEITRDEVIEADEVFLSYDRYEDLGEINDTEINTLSKFGIVKDIRSIVATDIRKKLYIDMDDTICDFSGRFIEHIKNEPGIKWPQSQYGFFVNLDPLPGAIEAVKELEKHYDVYILTRPSVFNPLCYTEKRVWIEKWLGIDMCHKLMLVPDKVLVPGDYLIDDADWSGFKGEHIWFRTEKFPNWKAVLEYLIP